MKFHRSILILALSGLCSPALANQNAGPEAVSPAPISPTAPDTAAPGPVTPGQIVDREFPTYDADKSGDLNAAEFSAWVSKLRKPAADSAPSADSQTWSAGLFARADTDHNQLVSKMEMTTLLASAARG